MITPDLPDAALAGGMTFKKWRALVGIGRTKAWELKRDGKIKVVSSYGIDFITAEGIRDFWAGVGAEMAGLNR